MIPKECKRLAEVDFPIAVVSQHSAREKSIRHGHPSTLHLWWARRPLAACRAMVLALLLPDPCDTNCPGDFKDRARNILSRVQGLPGKNDLDLRHELLRFVADSSAWDNAANSAYVEAARGLIRAAHNDQQPMVVDPFAGGGSIPLEALRLGCEVFASDLNPVACLILKTLLNDIPSCGSELTERLKIAGTDIRARADKELSGFYPSDVEGDDPIAYRWARTVICDSCGAEIPLVRSFWLSRKPNRRIALRPLIGKTGSQTPKITFEVFTPKADSEVPHGTVRLARATCLSCHTTLPPERVRSQLAKQNGGADVSFDDHGTRVGGAMVLAVYKVSVGGVRTYRAGRISDYEPVWRAKLALRELEKTALDEGLAVIPEELLPSPTGKGYENDGIYYNFIPLVLYGVSKWRQLFTPRQLLALVTLARLVRQYDRCGEQYSEAIRDLLALALGRSADQLSSLVRWLETREIVASTFGRQALPMIWDFCEIRPIGDQGANFMAAIQWICRVVEQVTGVVTSGGQSQQADACKSPLPTDTADVWFTDPPYYDAIPYADLSDFFFVWQKRCLPSRSALKGASVSDLNRELTPKLPEIIDTMELLRGAPKATAIQKGIPVKDRHFFEERMGVAFAEGRRVLSDDGVACVVFAHKSTEGWEALLSGIIKGGLIITASWPIATERAVRVRAIDSAALATSVHLICRPRAGDVVGDWGEVYRELPTRIGDWMERLQNEGIRGADLVFACIGPAMEIYSRYSRVEDAEGREIPLGGDPTSPEPYTRGYLAYVWETVGRLALEQVLGTAEAKARNGAAGALEEDARLTALFLWTLETTDTTFNGAEESGSNGEGEDEDEDKTEKSKSGFSLIYDVARRFAQPLGIHLDRWEGRIIETEKGVVRLLPVAERAMQLFGDADASAISRRIEQDVKASRNYTFAFMQDVAAPPEIKSRGRRRADASTATSVDAPIVQTVTTLDRVHAAMLLQASGQANGLRAMLKEEQQRGPDFLRLANALSALYPKDSEEKRLLDAMLLAVPR